MECIVSFDKDAGGFVFLIMVEGIEVSVDDFHHLFLLCGFEFALDE